MGAFRGSDRGVAVEKGGIWKFVDMTESSFVKSELHVDTVLFGAGCGGGFEDVFDDDVVDTDAGAG